MDPGNLEDDNGHWYPQHRSKKYRPSQLAKLNPIEKSRYLYYEKPTKEMTIAKEAALKRVRLEIRQRDAEAEDRRRKEVEKQQQEKHNELIGQLKAAEARNRIRLLRIRYNNVRNGELEQMIAYQPTSIRAVRLQALVPQKNNFLLSKADNMLKNDRHRIEEIIDDEEMATTKRDLTCI